MAILHIKYEKIKKGGIDKMNIKYSKFKIIFSFIIQNSCIAFYCQKFKGGLFGSCQKYYKTFWEYLSYCM